MLLSQFKRIRSAVDSTNNVRIPLVLIVDLRWNTKRRCGLYCEPSLKGICSHLPVTSLKYTMSLRRLFISALTCLLFCNTSLAQLALDPVKVSIRLAEELPLGPGDEATVEIVAQITRIPDGEAKYWHIYPSKDQHSGIEVPTSIKVTQLADGIQTGKIQWPPTSMVVNAFDMPQAVYEGTTVFRLPVRITETAKDGSQMVEVEFGYQACASLCLRPTSERLQLTLNVTADPSPDHNGQSVQAGTGRNKSGSHEQTRDPAGLNARAEPGHASTIERQDFRTNVFGTEFGFSATSWFSIPLLLLFAGIGGFLLNLTPCVLPVIPIKIMGLTQSAQGNTARTRILGVVMGLGILTFWIAIGAAISFVSGFDSISSLFQRPAFGIGVGLFIALMGIGMMTDHVIQLPQAVHRINPSHDNLHGAFLFGVMTAVLSTPCTAPFMGSTAAWATRAGNPVIVLSVFAAIAVGMGWPYVFLAWYPNLVSRIPRTGPASVLVKQVMGLLMLAVASFFGGTGLLGLVRERPHLGPVLHWWFAAFFVALTSIWLLWRSFQLTSGLFRRAAMSLLGLAMAAGMTYWAADETADAQATQSSGRHWQPFDAGRLADAKTGGQIAVVHFTADY